MSCMISHLPESLNGQIQFRLKRERKEYERIKKLEDDEIARRKLDAQEEIFQ